MNKKIYTIILTVLIALSLCGCGNSYSQTIDNQSTVEMNTDIEDNEPEFEIMTNMKKVKINEDNTCDFGFLVGTYSITEENRELAYEYTIDCNWKDSNEEITCLLMVLLDDIPVKFCLSENNNNEYKYEAEIAVTNHKMSRTRFMLDIDSMKNISRDTELSVLCIPMYNNMEWNPTTIIAAGCNLLYSKEVVNKLSLTESNTKQKTEINKMKSVVGLLGKNLDSMSRYTGLMRDFIYKGLDGKYYYIGNYKYDNELTTFFLMDGQFIETEAGIYSINWSGCNDYSVYCLDLPRVDGGEHALMAVTVVRNEGDVNAFRSELTLYE